MDLLPETLWQPVHSRLRADNTLWDGITHELRAHSAVFADAKSIEDWTASAICLRWATALLTIKKPTSKWFSSKAATTLGQTALTQLTHGEALTEAHTAQYFAQLSTPGQLLLTCFLAALQLQRQRGRWTSNQVWSKALAPHPNQPYAWKTTASVLYSSLENNSKLIWELASLGDPIALASMAHAMKVNETEASIDNKLQSLKEILPPEAYGQLALALEQDFIDLQQSVTTEDTKHLLESVEKGMLQPIGTTATNVDALVDAIENSQRLTAKIMAQLGQQLLSQDEVHAAQQAFEESLAGFKTEAAMLGLAKCHLALDEANLAINLLGQSPTKSVDRQLTMAAATLASGDNTQAAEIVRDVDLHTLHESERVSQQFQMAEILSNAHDYAGALNRLQDCIAKRPTNAEFYQLESHLHHSLGNLEAAIASATECVALAPKNPKAHLVLAKTLQASATTTTTNPKAALSAWSKAHALAPNDLSVAFGYVQCALDVQAPETAQKVIEKAIVELQTAPDIAFDQLGAGFTLLGRALQAQGKFDEAYQKYKEATELAPENAQPWRAVASYEASQGNIEEAIKILERGRQSVGASDRVQSAYLCVDLGDLHAQKHSHTEAISAYQEAISLVPDSGHYLHKLGNLLHEQGATQDALHVFEQASELDEANPQIWKMLGVLREELGQPLHSLQAFHQAAVLGFDSPTLLAKLVGLAHQLHRPAIVTEFLPKLLSGKSPTADQFLMLGKAYEETEAYDEAFEVYRQANAAYGNPEKWVLRQAKSLIKAGRAHLACTLIDDAKKQFEEPWQADVVLGDAYIALELWPDAMTAFDRVRMHVKEDMTVLAKYVDAAQHAGRTDEAIEALQEMTSLHPDSPALHLEMGKLYLNNSRGHLALGCFQKALHLNPGDVETLLTLSAFLQSMELYDDIIDMLTEAIGQHPILPIELQVDLATVYRKAKQYELAYDSYKVAADQIFVQRNGESQAEQAFCLMEAADSIYQLGQTDAAIETWRSALQLDPNNTAIAQQLGTALVDANKPADAISIIEPLLGRAPDDAELYDSAAAASIALGKPTSAKQYLQHNIATNQATGKTHFLLGEILFRHGDFANAQTAYETAQGLLLNDAQVLLGLSKTAIKLGKRVDAKHALDTLIKSDSAIAPTLVPEIALVYADAGFHQQGLSLLITRDGMLAQKRALWAQSTIALDLLQYMHVARLFEENSPEVTKKPIKEREIRRIAEQSFNRYRLEANAKETSAVDLLRARLQTLLAGQLIDVETLQSFHQEERGTHLAHDSVIIALQQSKFELAQHYADIAQLWHLTPLGGDLKQLAALVLQELKGQPATLIVSDAGASPRILYMQAKRAEDSKRLLEAEQYLLEALRKNKTQVIWHARLANVQLALNKYEAALSTCQTAVTLAKRYRLSPQRQAHLYAQLAQAQIADNDSTHAIANLETAIELVKDVPVSWQAMLGELYLKTDKFEAAIREFSNAAKQVPNDTGPLLGAAKAYAKQGNIEMSEALASQAVRKDPLNAEAWTALGNSFALNGKPVEADDAFIKAREVATDPIPAMLAHAKVLRDAHLYQDALQLAVEVLEIDGLRASAWALRGFLHAQLGKPAQAINAYEKARELEPAHPNHARAQAKIYRQIGQLDKALECLEIALDLQHSNRLLAEVFDELAQTLKDRREYERAIEAWQKAMEFDTHKAEYPFRMGELLFQQFHDIPGARSLLSQAAQLEPSRREIQHLLDTIQARNMYENGTEMIQ